MWPFRSKPEPLGPAGERIARRALKRRGMKILAANYRCGAGEIDLIVLDRSTRKRLGGETIAFVEVKTRSRDDYVPPSSAVNARKQARIRKASRQYLAAHDTDGYALRYDIVSIVLRDDGRPDIDYRPGAF